VPALRSRPPLKPKVGWKIDLAPRLSSLPINIGDAADRVREDCVRVSKGRASLAHAVKPIVAASEGNVGVTVANPLEAIGARPKIASHENVLSIVYPETPTVVPSPCLVELHRQ
jgi:hypothetical protein